MKSVANIVRKAVGIKDPTIEEALSVMKEAPFNMSEFEVNCLISNAKRIQKATNMSEGDVARLLIRDAKELKAANFDSAAMNPEPEADEDFDAEEEDAEEEEEEDAEEEDAEEEDAEVDHAAFIG